MPEGDVPREMNNAGSMALKTIDRGKMNWQL